MATEPTTSVTVQFFGICTHFQPASIALNPIAPPSPTDWAHRVVLVNASDPGKFDAIPPLRDARIGAHVATLQIRKVDMEDGNNPPNETWFPLQPGSEVDDTFVWKLNGVFLRISNAVETTADPKTTDCIPHLRDYVRPLSLAKAGPRTSETISTETASFFDFPLTPLVGTLFGKAAVGVLNVAVQGQPTIEVIGFGGETLSFGINPQTQVSVCNIPLDLTTDKDQDFLLHFLTVEPPFPTTAFWPVDQTLCTQPLTTNNPPRGFSTTQITTEGCSNSTYP